MAGWRGKTCFIMSNNKYIEKKSFASLRAGNAAGGAASAKGKWGGGEEELDHTKEIFERTRRIMKRGRRIDFNTIHQEYMTTGGLMKVCENGVKRGYTRGGVVVKWKRFNK